MDAYKFICAVLYSLGVVRAILTPEQWESYKESVHKDNLRYDWNHYASRFVDL